MLAPGSESLSDLFAVIPAGGSGLRLWPLSRATAPKFLHPLSGPGDRSMLQATVDRLDPLVSRERVLVVTGAAHVAAVRAQLPELDPANVIAEPAPRESAPAIAMAAALLAERSPGAVMASFAADHLIADVPGLHDVLRTGYGAAQDGHLVTIGIRPDRPETGYGYLRVGEPLGDTGARLVPEFREKPDQATAESYLASGAYLWNAGMFLWRVDVFLDQLALELPELHAGVRALAGRWADLSAADYERAWRALPRISIDHGLMQPASARGVVATVPAEFGWADVGDWHTLGTILPGDDAGNAVLAGSAAAGGSVLVRDAHNCVVHPGGGRPIALLGVDDLAVIDTGDVLLVCSRARAQEVKALVEQARDEGYDSLL